LIFGFGTERTYKGASPADDYGYRHEVVFEMKGGKMGSVDYDEIHKNLYAKQHDAYCKQMLKSGTTPEIAPDLLNSDTLQARFQSG
jgi:hypothetical protein